MNTFAQTKDGHEFLYGTMPRLARNIEENTKAIKALTEAVKTSNSSNNLNNANDVIRNLIIMIAEANAYVKNSDDFKKMICINSGLSERDFEMIMEEGGAE